ncbi:MAG: ribosome biogenesis factor YjgA [Gammaproteobacteria bacterium]
MNGFNEELEGQVPSKSQLKRDDTALQELASEMACLSEAQLASLTLPERLFDEIRAATAMPPKGARKRQIKYIGGLLRQMDVSPIREQLEKIKSRGAKSVREHHQIEQWRDRLVAGDEGALTELIDMYPGADRQQIRQLVRAAKKETETGKPPKSSRLIYRFLKHLFEEAS